jgi:hypothetical protein
MTARKHIHSPVALAKVMFYIGRGFHWILGRSGHYIPFWAPLFKGALLVGAYCLEMECLRSMLKASGSIPSIGGKKKKGQGMTG